MFLEGRFVQVHSLAQSLEPNAETRAKDPGALPLDMNGKQGLCLRWDPDERKYLVLAFEGFMVGVPEENLGELEPQEPEHGGFDVAWNAATGMDDGTFASIVGTRLVERGYCVVQMFTSPAVRESAKEEALRRPMFEESRAETEAAYLGEDNVTRCALMEPDSVESVLEDGLAYCDRDLTDMGYLLGPLAPDLLGFQPDSRSATLVRTRIPDADEALSPPPLEDKDLAEQYVERFMGWMLRRKVCMLHLVANEGGALELYPKDALGVGTETVRLPLRPSRLVLFRHDMMGYSYRPEGDSLALQSWLLAPMVTFEFRQLDSAPYQMGSDAVHMISAHETFPAQCDGCDETFRCFTAGTDALTGVPIARFDQDLYVAWGDPTAPAFGKAYTMHGALIDHQRLVSFDNEFFGISDEEAMAMAPSQRWVLETGYVTLFKGGWTKRTLAKKRVGTFMGDSGSEWNATRMRIDKYEATCNNNTVTIGRLAHCMNLTGPVLSVDTACSASLVAANSACHMMRRYVRKDQDGFINEQANNESVRHALVGGILAMVHPGGWIGECASKMLSLRGRCFTWDASADGFIRGEGCCMAYLRSQHTDEEEAAQRHLATIMGTCVTANGRGASLTAPSGPAQGMAIRQSLREGGVAPSEVGIGECHGTATALGDPIEIGAVRTIMLKNREHFPHMHSTAKAHVGHEEANAGACALIKAMLMANASVSTPNPGLKTVNPNIDVSGYPVLLVNELTPTSMASNINGVSSFGFGGSIAVAHVWADAEKGVWKDGQRIMLDKEEAVNWINKVIRSCDANEDIDGIYTGHKKGH